MAKMPFKVNPYKIPQTQEGITPDPRMVPHRGLEPDLIDYPGQVPSGVLSGKPGPVTDPMDELKDMFRFLIFNYKPDYATDFDVIGTQTGIEE